MASPNVTFLGRVPFDVLKDYYARCRALVFPGIEDFGIMPLEVMASGRPVIAYAKGGAQETVVDGVTGIHFHEQSVPALEEAISRCEALMEDFDPAALVRHAEGFSAELFRDRMASFVEQKRREAASA